MATQDPGAASATSQNEPTHVDGAQGAGRTAPKETHLTEREALFERAVQHREAEYLAAPAEAQAAAESEGTPAAAEPPVKATPAAAGPAPEPNLDDFVVVKDGKPMLKLKVDGRDVLQPLATARATLQKHQAAERRLQEAAEIRRQADARAAEVQRREQEVQRREQAATQQQTAAPARSQPSAAPAAVDDQGLQNEAKELVASLLRDSEDEAAKKVAKVLAKVRQAPAAPVVDVNAIANNVAQAVKGQIRQEAVEKDMVSGYHQFQNDYPEIAGDPNLYRIADGLTTDIAKDHPDWNPSQVMAEAGKQTREWLQSIGSPAAAASTTTAPKGGTKPTDRQTTKQNLRPMPAARTARQQAEPTEPARDDPRAALAEMRKARGQAV